MTTIAFPRTMPAVGGNALRFGLLRSDYLSQEKGGRLLAVAGAWPLWGMSLGLNNLSEGNADIWTAWVDVQRGPQKLFYGYHLTRELPKAYRSGGTYTHNAATWSQTINADGTALLTLTGLAALQIVSLGDYIGFIWDTYKRALVRSVETVVADGSGSVTVAVEPPVPTMVVIDDATATVHQPTCLMRITPDTSLGEQMAGGYTAAGGQIVAIQDLVGLGPFVLDQSQLDGGSTLS